jgi:hypothetical protein
MQNKNKHSKDAHRGYVTLKNLPKETHLGRIFDLGICKLETTLTWGYAEGYNFCLGVRKYQKVENLWSKPFFLNPENKTLN